MLAIFLAYKYCSGANDVAKHHTTTMRRIASLNINFHLFTEEMRWAKLTCSLFNSHIESAKLFDFSDFFYAQRQHCMLGRHVCVYCFRLLNNFALQKQQTTQI